MIRVGRARTDAGRSRGQVLVMFAAGLPLFLGMMALVIDVGTIWNESIHVQLAAEAAAMAGVPYMPGDFATATSVAKAEAAKNGYQVAERDGRPGCERRFQPAPRRGNHR